MSVLLVSSFLDKFDLQQSDGWHFKFTTVPCHNYVEDPWNITIIGYCKKKPNSYLVLTKHKNDDTTWKSRPDLLDIKFSFICEPLTAFEIKFYKENKQHKNYVTIGLNFAENKIWYCTLKKIEHKLQPYVHTKRKNTYLNKVVVNGRTLSKKELTKAACNWMNYYGHNIIQIEVVPHKSTYYRRFKVTDNDGHTKALRTLNQSVQFLQQRLKRNFWDDMKINGKQFLTDTPIVDTKSVMLFD